MEFILSIDRASDGHFHIDVEEVTDPADERVGRGQRLPGSPWRTANGNDLHGKANLRDLLHGVVADALFEHSKETS